jgi:uncharacterized protein YndB with AHSA1/START domain
VTTDRTLHIERTYQAPIDRVFDAWTSETVLRRWFRTEDRYDESEAEVDLRVGGTIRVVMRDPARAAEYGGEGKYTEIDRPRRLAFTWLWDGDSTRTLIEIDFEETGDGTHVRFTHRGLWDEEAVRGHEDGWTKVFNRLGGLLAAEGEAPV